MSLRGEAHRAAMRAVLDVFGDDARSFVFVGGCVLGLYARATGAPLRTTKDVDCISTVTPWVIQEHKLADMCSRGILTPDPELQCRYRIRGSDIDVDILSPDGLNVGGVNPWFERAVRRAQPYEVGGSRTVTAMTPPHFLATKLVAFESRGPDAQSSKDAEDIVGLMVEVDDLVARVDVADLWARAMRKYGIADVDLPDFVDWHLEPREAEHRDRVVEAVITLVRG